MRDHVSVACDTRQVQLRAQRADSGRLAACKEELGMMRDKNEE